MQVDLQHSLSRVIRADLYAVDPKTSYEVIRPRVNKEAMVKERCRVPNMCTSGEDWNAELNKLVPLTCVNFFVHRAPVSFENEQAWLEHREERAGPVASTSKSSGSRGKSGRGRCTRPHPK